MGYGAREANGEGLIPNPKAMPPRSSRWLDLAPQSGGVGNKLAAQAATPSLQWLQFLPPLLPWKMPHARHKACKKINFDPNWELAKVEKP